jgi:hypothetical protein
MLRLRFGATLLCSALLAAMIAGCGSSQADIATPAGYCRSVGGAVQARLPEYGPNGQNPLRLAGTKEFCKFTAQDKSAIVISTDTLFSQQPTLAALAYYAKTPPKSAPVGENPGSVYCSQLGGSDLFGGVNASGGGWVDSGDKAFRSLSRSARPTTPPARFAART